MKRFIYLPLFIALLAPLLFANACAPTASNETRMAPASALPAAVQSAPSSVREAYQFAMANPSVLKQIPCYCGCGAVGHTSNYACYIKEARADGTFIFDDHALG